MTSKKQRNSPGPTPDTVKIGQDWESAVGKALKKPRPKDGWPEAAKKKPGEKGA